MKKIVSLALLGATTSLMALGGEQASLYKDPRVMGMGGANVAVGSYSSAVFSNPAGLTNIEKDHGFVVDILSVGVTVSAQTQEFMDDLDGAGDDAAQIEEIINKYSGEAFNVQASNYSSVSKNSDAFAWSVGILAATDVSLMVHGNGSSTGAPIEAAGRAYGGLVLGAAKEYDTSAGQLDIGLGLKYIQQTSYEGPLYVSDLQGDNAMEKLQEKYEKEATGFGVDLGINYKPFQNSKWHPSFGLSVL
ncbi:MAG: conjugal transfer protein TraF, partial [Campylobacterota bacterium]|nr:conjugal transfer protein TraF [Campylobacterota bacterium]